MCRTPQLNNQLMRWFACDPDGSVHVAEMAIDGALFHLHEVDYSHHTILVYGGLEAGFLPWADPKRDRFWLAAFFHDLSQSDGRFRNLHIDPSRESTLDTASGCR